LSVIPIIWAQFITDMCDLQICTYYSFLCQLAKYIREAKGQTSNDTCSHTYNKKIKEISRKLK